MRDQTTTYTPTAEELATIALPAGGMSIWSPETLAQAIKRVADGVAYAQGLASTAASDSIPKSILTAADQVLIGTASETPGVVQLTADTVIGKRSGAAAALPVGVSTSASILDRAAGDGRYTPLLLSESYTFTDTTINSSALAIPSTSGSDSITWYSYRVGVELALAMTSSVFIVQYNSVTPGVARDTYTSPSTENAPGIRTALALPARRPPRGRTLRFRANVRQDKPTSHNAVGEWCRPGIMLRGFMPGASGAASWVYLFAEANTGVYQVQGVWNQGAVTSGTLGTVAVTSGSLITGYDLELTMTHDGRINGAYKETASSIWIALPTTRYAHGFEPLEVMLVTSHGTIDAGAGTVTAQTQSVTLEVF